MRNVPWNEQDPLSFIPVLVARATQWLAEARAKILDLELAYNRLESDDDPSKYDYAKTVVAEAQAEAKADFIAWENIILNVTKNPTWLRKTSEHVGIWKTVWMAVCGQDQKTIRECFDSLSLNYRGWDQLWTGEPQDYDLDHILS